MILYNVTVNIAEDVHDEWVNWMRHRHIPDVMATGLFHSYRMFRILSRQEDETGFTYSIQYFLESLEKFEEYAEEHAPRLQREHTDRYSGKFAAFRTMLEDVE